MNDVTVQLLTAIAGARFSFRKRDQVMLPAEVAQKWIDAGIATRIEDSAGEINHVADVIASIGAGTLAPSDVLALKAAIAQLEGTQVAVTPPVTKPAPATKPNASTKAPASKAKPPTKPKPATPEEAAVVSGVVAE